MKPVNINLVIKKNIWGKSSVILAALFVFATCGFTMVNIYDYYANTKVIQTYESRLKKINKRSKQNEIIDRKKTVTTTEEEKKFQQDLNYLKAVITKNMFPLAEVLTQIEIIKPDKIDIKALIFLDNLKTIVIKGASSNVSQVSLFLKNLDKSQYFVIELSKGEINENKRIIFELTAKWISVDNDQTI